jgi:hypothetical protein
VCCSLSCVVGFPAAHSCLVRSCFAALLPPLPCVSRGSKALAVSTRCAAPHGCSLCAVRRLTFVRPRTAQPHPWLLLACGSVAAQPAALVPRALPGWLRLPLAAASRLDLTPNPRDQPGAFCLYLYLIASAIPEGQQIARLTKGQGLFRPSSFKFCIS